MSVQRKWWQRWSETLQRVRPFDETPRAEVFAAPPSSISASASVNAAANAAAGAMASATVSSDLENSSTVGARGGMQAMPRPALKWVGHGARIALRSFDFAADADAVCAFQEETYTLNFPDFAFSTEFAQAFRHDLRRSSLDSNHALFVLDDGRVVGFLWLVVCENNWTRERYGYINNIYLAPTQRAQGLGDALMAQADAFFRNRRIHRIRLTVTASNRAAIGLYNRGGYATTRWEMEKEL